MMQLFSVYRRKNLIFYSGPQQKTYREWVEIS